MLFQSGSYSDTGLPMRDSNVSVVHETWLVNKSFHGFYEEKPELELKSLGGEQNPGGKHRRTKTVQTDSFLSANTLNMCYLFKSYQGVTLVKQWMWVPESSGDWISEQLNTNI